MRLFEFLLDFAIVKKKWKYLKRAGGVIQEGFSKLIKESPEGDDFTSFEATTMRWKEHLREFLSSISKKLKVCIL